MQDSTSKQRIATKYQALSGLMDERISRQWAAAEAAAHPWGGGGAGGGGTGTGGRGLRLGGCARGECGHGHVAAHHPQGVGRTGGAGGEPRRADRDPNSS